MGYLNDKPAAYRLTHEPSGYFYVGASGSYRDRLRKHIYLLNRGTHHNRRFQAVYTTWEDIRVEVFEAKDRCEALELEQRLLDEFLGSAMCCNTALSSTDPTLGVISLESRQVGGRKSGLMMKGRRKSEEWKSNLSKSASREPRDEDTKLKISLGKSRKVSVGGVVYDSAYALAKELDIPVMTVRNRIYSDSPRFKDWLFI